LARQIGEVSVFFTSTHYQSNNFFRLVYRSQNRNMLSILSSKHVVSRTDVPFGGYNI